MKIETNNYSQPSFNATLQLKGNTKLIKEPQDLILKVFAERFGGYSDIIDTSLGDQCLCKTERSGQGTVLFPVLLVAGGTD